MDASQLLEKLFTRTCRMQDANYAAAAFFTRMSQATGLPGVILSAITATAVFSSLQESAALWIQISAGTTAILAAVASAATAFLRFPEKAEQHRQIGSRYASLKREVELLLTFPCKDMETSLVELSQRWDALTNEAPVIPDRIWKKFERTDYEAERSHS